jgi:hypothetical protein
MCRLPFLWSLLCAWGLLSTLSTLVMKCAWYRGVMVTLGHLSIGCIVAFTAGRVMVMEQERLRSIIMRNVRKSLDIAATRPLAETELLWIFRN